jgi:hypothetical protein
MLMQVVYIIATVLKRVKISPAFSHLFKVFSFLILYGLLNQQTQRVEINDLLGRRRERDGISCSIYLT